MFSWLAKTLIARNMSAINRGDMGPTLALDADDIRFRFPGESSWAADLEGKDELTAWLRRFVDAGIQIHPDEVILQGFPWKQTICVRGHDYVDAPDGRRVYENRYVIWGRIAWGRLREYEVYEDTQRTPALDEYLAERSSAAP